MVEGGAQCQFWIQRLPLNRRAASWLPGDFARLTVHGLASPTIPSSTLRICLRPSASYSKNVTRSNRSWCARKGTGSPYPVEERIADEMAEQCDVVIAAIGD